MPYLLVCFLWNISLAQSQNQYHMTHQLDPIYLKDSIALDHQVTFEQSGDGTKLVRFQIRVTNLGDQPIPSFRNVSDRSEFLQLLVNNQNTFDMNITNGIGPDHKHFLYKGESDTFSTAWTLEPPHYTTPIAVTWQYFERRASTVMVDLVQRKIVE